MDSIITFFQNASSLGVSVIMPVIMTVMGLCFGVSFGKSLKAGLTVGIGFIGLNLVLGSLMGGDLAGAVADMVGRFGLELSVVDVGWPAASAIAMGSFVGAVIIPLSLLVNIIMLATNTTQTADVDIWNYWHFAFTGALVAIVTNNIAFGIGAAVINEVIILVIGDVTAKQVEKSLGLPGVSLPHGLSAAYAPIAWVANKVFDLIPGVRDITFDIKTLQKRFGVFGDPVLLGSAIGLGIGVLAGYDFLPKDGKPSYLAVAVSMGAVMILIPKMASLLMEGLIPISEAASKFIQKHFKDRAKIFIGLDSAVGTGNSTTLTLSLILVPFTILLALILPGNKVMPLVDLAVIPFMLVLVTPIVRDNAFRGLIVGIIVIAAGLYIATDLSPLITSAAANVNFDMGSAVQISSLCDGANPITWVLVRLCALFEGVGIVIPAVFALGLALWNRSRILKEAKRLHQH